MDLIDLSALRTDEVAYETGEYGFGNEGISSNAGMGTVTIFPGNVENVVKAHTIYFIVKRVTDVFLSFLALTLLLPVFLLTALAIKVDSRGKVIFSQIRTGKDGRLFKIYKFRSMYEDAEKRRRELDELNEMDGPMFKMMEDPRVTKVGRFIRKYSIDELPQLINIIKGDMSIVGPRPLIVAETKQFNDYENMRHLVRPGLTCFWQISGRSDTSFSELIRLDLLYLKKMGFWSDIKIIIRTIGVVLIGKGAY